jgi:DNA end-binding protein Ku
VAAVYPRDNLLVLDTLRYANELRDAGDIKAPDLKEAKVKPNELAMAERLIKDMEIEWKPRDFHDTYRDDLLKMIHEKAAGKVRELPKAKRGKEAEVIDFASLLEKSLSARRKGGAASAANDEDEEATPRRAEPRKRAAAKTTRRKAASPKSTHHRAA